jgi:hypothetical protein
MTRALLRSMAVAVAVVGTLAAVEYTHFAAFCEKHLAWNRAQAGSSDVVVRDAGIRVARAGDAIYTCTTTHCFGPLGCHDDLGCYCAPAALGPAAVGQFVGGSCTVDKVEPRLSDAFGACRHARCDDHIGP